MSMSRAEHFRRAEALLSMADSNPGAGRPRLTEVDRERVALAQVHATLATVPPGVELEAAHGGGPVVGGTPEEPTVFGLTLDQVAERLDRLGRAERALIELESGQVAVTGAGAAGYIRSALNGGQA